MFKWIKKLSEKKKQKLEQLKQRQEWERIICYPTEEEKKEIDELLLLRDPICGKHHG